MAFSTAGNSVLRAEINVTPMIDILLVLMIVFMVAVTMSGEKGLQAEIPDRGGSSAVAQDQRREREVAGFA